MSGRGARLAIGSLTLCVASAAAAQGNLDHGKTAAQLYASACATCHQSPQSVSNTKRLLGLESFLSEHYTSSRESAAILAAYLRGMAKPSAACQSGRGVAKRTSQAMPAEPMPSVSEGDIPRPPASSAFSAESIAAFDTSTRHLPTEWCEWLLRLSGLAARCPV